MVIAKSTYITQSHTYQNTAFYVYIYQCLYVRLKVRVRDVNGHTQNKTAFIQILNNNVDARAFGFLCVRELLCGVVFPFNRSQVCVQGVVHLIEASTLNSCVRAGGFHCIVSKLPLNRECGMCSGAQYFVNQSAAM